MATISVELSADTHLAELLGVHDSHLKVLEDWFGAPVYLRGDKVILDHGDENQKSLFTMVFSELESLVDAGVPLNDTLVREVLGLLGNKGPNAENPLKKTSINIPGALSRVFPRTLRQARYIEAMQTREMVFGIGPAGTGKTWLAVAVALELLLTRRKRKILMTRPVVEAGENLGYLPGDLTQKLGPYLRPLHDVMEALLPQDLLNRIEQNNLLETAPLAYMRGRSLANCVVILDEAQNATREQMKMFLTRMGQDTTMIVTGDLTQIDLRRKDDSGLFHARTILAEIPEIHMEHFLSEDVIRNPLVKKIVQAYENERT